jgi:protein-S-isoprenylcysteine O-methyltransferase Ste14
MIVVALWVLFWLSWIAASGWSSTADKQAGTRRELGYRALMILGGLVLFVPAHGYRGPLRLWMVTSGIAWACVAAIVAGFMFSWWARIHLGALWSGRITKKKDHRVVDTGPYALVRHPIYTGILFAIYATAALKGTVLGLVGAAIVTAGVYLKARLEEVWLAQELEPDAYARYRRRVPMLVPFGPKASREPGRQ